MDQKCASEKLLAEIFISKKLLEHNTCFKIFCYLQIKKAESVQITTFSLSAGY